MRVEEFKYDTTVKDLHSQCKDFIQDPKKFPETLAVRVFEGTKIISSSNADGEAEHHSMSYKVFKLTNNLSKREMSFLKCMHPRCLAKA